MHYYVFKTTEANPVLKKCGFLDKFEVFKNTKHYAQQLRRKLPLNTNTTIKMVHVASELQAQELLQEKRKKR